MKFKNSYMKNFLKFFICILISFTIIATVNASENYVNENKEINVGRAGSNAVNYFIRHSKDTKLNHAIAEGLWYVNVENPVNMLKTASNKVVDIFGEKNNG